jgi:hypothetical protein
MTAAMTAGELLSHLRDVPPSAVVEVVIHGAHVAAGPGWRNARGRLVSLTTGNREGTEVLLLNAQAP